MSALAQEATVCVCGFNHLCACGCGEEVNPNLRRVHELVAAGCTHRAAAEIIGISREGVSILFRKPPRYVKGHLSAEQRETGRLRQLASHERRRNLERKMYKKSILRHCFKKIAAGDVHWAYRTSGGIAQVFGDEYPHLLTALRSELRRPRVETAIRLWNATHRSLEPRPPLSRDVRGAVRRAEIEARRQERRAEIEARRQVQRLFQAVGIAARCEISRMRREERLTSSWTKRALRDQKRYLLTHDKARAALQRKVDAATLDDTLYASSLSLDATLGSQFEDGDVGTFLAVTENRMAEDQIAEIQRDEFWKLVGDLTPDEVARMDPHSLRRLQERLMQAGVVNISVTDAERERLRDDTRHSGRSVAASGGHGSRKTRLQKIEHKQANRNRGNSNRPSQKPMKRWERV